MVPPTTVPPTTGAPATVPPTTAPFDPSRPWWMQGNFAPVTAEVESTELTVRGAIPPELTGLYVRNGSNPQSGDSPHWFFGDGMVHGVRLEDGKAAWYRNRYVNTPMYEAGAGFGEGSARRGVEPVERVGDLARRPAADERRGRAARTSCRPDRPRHRRPLRLRRRADDAFTAHPKIDPATGRLHFFGYGFVPPVPHVPRHRGRRHDGHVETDRYPGQRTMIHDFTITETDAVFWELPVVFDLDGGNEVHRRSASRGVPVPVGARRRRPRRRDAARRRRRPSAVVRHRPVLRVPRRQRVPTRRRGRARRLPARVDVRPGRGARR